MGIDFFMFDVFKFLKLETVISRVTVGALTLM